MPLTFRINNNIGFIEFDQPDSKVNLLTSAVMQQLDSILDEVKNNSSLRAVVFTSRKKDIFIAGADIKEIEGITREEEGRAKSQTGQEILNKLEDLPLPTIAVIDGVALGGGCEFALACRYRVATFNEKVRIGLPEVNLGFVPGFGGTYRLVRLIGLSEGLKMITAGRAVTGQQAMRIGLVDRLYPQVGLEQQVRQFVEEVAGSPTRKFPHKRKKDLAGFLEQSRLGHALIFDQARKSILKATKGFYPAPLKAVEVVQKTLNAQRAKALNIEAETFGRLAVTEKSKNLIHVFYLTEKYKKLSVPGAEGIAPKAIRKCGVLGAGVMGGGIAQLLSSRNIWVRMKDIQYDALAKGLQAAAKIYSQAVKRKRLKSYEAERQMGHITTTTDYSGFKTADAVIEAVVEKMEVKRKVFQELSEEVSPGTLLCTNTSALSVTEMAKATKEPGRVIGLHFFNPVHRMPLVEMITTPMTSTETIVSSLDFVRQLGKTPILVKDSRGFLVNRILLSYLNEAGRILEEGGTIEEIDRAVTAFGMPMGPFELTDEVGLDVGAKVLQILFEAFGERFKPVATFGKVLEKGWLGKKTGKGFYIHAKQRIVNPEIFSLVVVHKSQNGSPEEWLHRMVLMMVNEAGRCLEEGIVDSAATVDVGMILGTGFPPFRGGLLKYADQWGIDNVVDTLSLFEGKFASARFKPCDYLLNLKSDRKKFYP